MESSVSPGEARLLKLGRDVTSTLDLQAVLDASFRAIRELIEFDGGAIALREGDHLRLAATDPPATSEALKVRLPLGQGITGSIAVTGEPEYLPDIERDRRVYPEGRKRATSPGVRSWFGVPLIMHGDPIGVLSIDAMRVDAFPQRDRTLLVAFVPTITAAVQNALLFNRELQAIDELREAERLKDDFLAVVSHELRTPLTSIAGLAETLILRAGRLDHQLIEEFGQRIAGAAHRLERIISDVLNISQIERGALQVTLAPTPLPDVIRQVVQEAGSTPHEITLAIDSRLPHVTADPDRIHQIIGNLIDNARKFSPPGSPIHIEARLEGDRVAVRIRDHGSGVPSEALPRIFDRFYQVHRAATRETGGLGIGLYLVKHLTERMGGEVGVSSVVGKGTTFTVLLRRADVRIDLDATEASRSA